MKRADIIRYAPVAESLIQKYFIDKYSYLFFRNSIGFIIDAALTQVEGLKEMKVSTYRLDTAVSFQWQIKK